MTSTEQPILNTTSPQSPTTNHPKKVVVVSGANRGIGHEFTRQLLLSPQPPLSILLPESFCTNGYTVIALSRIVDDTHWSSLQTELNTFNATTSGDNTRSLVPFQCDVTNINDINNLVNYITTTHNARVDVFISNAGIIEPDPSTSVDQLTTFDPYLTTILTTNTIAPVVMTNNLAPLMMNAHKSTNALKNPQDAHNTINNDNTLETSKFDSTVDPGVKINNNDNNCEQYVQCSYVSSNMGSISLTNMPLCPTYRASKCALNMYIKTLSLQYPLINFIALSPGWVATDMGSRGGRSPPTNVVDSVNGMLTKMSKYCTKGDSGMKLVSFDDSSTDGSDEIPW